MGLPLQRRFLCGDESAKAAVVRNAQASEVFRAAFLDASNNNDRISVNDLDDLISAQRVRPSALLGVFQIAGLVLGTATKLSPAPYANVLKKVVHDATLQQFNESIRVIQQEGDAGDIDTKETIKYHRDIDVGQAVAGSSEAVSDTGATFTSTTALYNILKVSRSI